ncbi:ATP-binding cassette domain-containing protein [Pseudomonas syringae]|nr:ATP-binding cassette domain-containing protein [Pseudomonas syringae]MDC6490154.1 ATP-binding cassette domain-containing protein [Pseudomonas syringae]MDC6495822.1 ATP-binding cassette domain-containing protein [Pseudomonas syringae]MDC6500329.1 ATP-binding cassette domain-containing protein [Pseudomonas syringae]MDC6510702.1 ATP-binding cassette domain-containing protein [Pseudomonas syringae]MDC6527348.1 ATP-binding cassette domain-containing protein [Pseudomonas syringae]
MTTKIPTTIIVKIFYKSVTHSTVDSVVKGLQAMDCISVKNLSKTYQIKKNSEGPFDWLKSLAYPKISKKTAVDDISFNVSQGEIVGFLGPNGAGKTTTLKMLSGLLYPTSGQISVLGYQPQTRSKEFLKSISLIMGQRQQLIWDLPAMETFRLNQKIFEISDEQFKQTYGYLDELLQVSKLAKAPVRTLSLGEKMKCELVASLLHNPKVLFLDEPTIGLDVGVQKIVRSFIRDYSRERNVSVLLTSHYMQDIEALCERVVVISDGKISFDDTLESLRKRMSDHRIITVELSESVMASALGRYGLVRSVDGFVHELLVPAAEVVGVCSQVLAEQAVVDISIGDPPIEEALLKLFTDSQADAGQKLKGAPGERAA